MIAQRDFVNLKSRLTRAKNSGDPRKVIAEVSHALDIFERDGFPDDWPRWRIAEEDAYAQLGEWFHDNPRWF